MKARRILVAFLAILLMVPMGAFADRIKETIAAGGVSITVDADMPDVPVSEAARYMVQPHEWDVRTIVQTFWPDGDADAILSGVEKGEVEVERDGKPLYSERYTHEENNLSFRVNEGKFVFSSASYDAWVAKYYKRLEESNPSDKDSTWSSVDTSSWYTHKEGDVLSEIATMEEMTGQVERLLTSLGLEVEIQLIAQVSTTETIDGEAYSINTVDYAIVSDGLLCDNRAYVTALSTADRQIPAQYISASFDQYGLCTFDCTLFDVVSREQAAPLLGYSTALDSMADAYSKLVASDTVEINSVSLCYVMTPIPSKMLVYNYEPAWRLGTEAESWTAANVANGEIFYFSALTGDPIR